MLSELKDALFGTTENEYVPDGEMHEIEGQVTINETYQPVFEDTLEESETVETPEELIRESMSAVERMKQEIAAENENLDRRFARPALAAPVDNRHKRRPVYVIGVLSAAASLLFMGVMLLISLLTSPIGAYAAIKASPVILIFLGAEIIFAVFRKKSLRIRIDIRSVIVMGALILVSCILSVISVTASAGTGERVYAEQRIQNMLADELHDTIAKDYIRSVDIETQLFGDNAEMYRSPSDLTDGDIINLTVNFADAQMSIREFAKECKDILGDMRDLSYNFGHIDFIAEDRVNRYSLEIDWHYQSDYSSDRLATLVNYFGDGISDTDIPDIIDDD